MRAVLTALALAVGAAPVASQTEAPRRAGLERQDEESFEPALFQLYDTQAARAIASEALEHIEAARWPEAIAPLRHGPRSAPGAVRW
ncbi:MAG: hypothetical protein AAFP22_05060, partial [Planctomycetota bacterium]